MATSLIRTLLIYLLLILALRITGKRQIGELEISELVTTFLISEIAAAPIGNQEISLSFAIFPILTIISLEVIVSFLSTRSPLMKKIFLGAPMVLVRRGILQQKELSRARMSVEELCSELRQNGLASIEEAAYVIMENNGKLSVIPHTKHKPATVGDLQLPIEESGIAHAVIIDGAIKKEALAGAGYSKDWLQNAIQKTGLAQKELFLLTVDDLGEVQVIRKDRQK